MVSALFALSENLSLLRPCVALPSSFRTLKRSSTTCKDTEAHRTHRVPFESRTRADCPVVEAFRGGDSEEEEDPISCHFAKPSETDPDPEPRWLRSTEG